MKIGDAAIVLLLLFKQANNGGNYLLGLGLHRGFSFRFLTEPLFKRHVKGQ
jgi:hypothetical protein